MGNAYPEHGHELHLLPEPGCCVDANNDGRCDNGVQFTADGLNPSILASGAGVRNVNAIVDDFELPSVWKANLAFDHELPWHGVVASAEVPLTDVKNGIFYKSLNVGPGYVGPMVACTGTRMRRTSCRRRTTASAATATSATSTCSTTPTRAGASS